MAEEDVYDNIVQTLVKWIIDFKDDVCPTAEYLNWDAHSQIAELPKDGILIGPAGCGLADEDDGMIEAVFSFGVSTINDPNLFELTKIISKLRGRLRPATKIPVYDHDTAVIQSWMVVKTPIAITPVTKAEVRSIQFINLTALVSPGGPSSP
jgi:hypothetical protein